MTLLIVDDEARIRDLIRKYAAFEGYNVEEASNGMEAIEKCRQKNYDLIIMDVMMPELDGFSACREIRRKSQVPVIMLSARGEEYDRIHGFELGIDDYVVKPFSPKELMRRTFTSCTQFSSASEISLTGFPSVSARTMKSESLSLSVRPSMWITVNSAALPRTVLILKSVSFLKESIMRCLLSIVFFRLLGLV